MSDSQAGDGGVLARSKLEPPPMVVMLRCATTGMPVRSNLHIDERLWHLARLENTRIKCPRCGEWHPFEKKDTWLDKDTGPSEDDSSIESAGLIDLSGSGTWYEKPTLTTEKIKAALSPEQWAEELSKIAADEREGVPFWRGSSTIMQRQGPRAAAAVYLDWLGRYGRQPGGLTRQDARDVFQGALSMRYEHQVGGCRPSDNCGCERMAARLVELAARIEALLPPA